MQIDLIELAQDPQRDIISGREVGRRAAGRFELTHPVGPGQDIVIILPDHVRVVTASFFTGLLSRAVANMGSADEARRRVVLNRASDTTKLNLFHALNTLLAKRSPLDSLR